MTVVFFCPNILRDAHRYIFDLDHLQADGYNFVMLDATKFYGNTSTATEKIIIENTVECATKEDFIAFRNHLPKNSVLYLSSNNYMKSAAPIFDIIIRKQDVMLSYHTKRFTSVDQPSNKLRIIFDKVISGLDELLPLHYFKLYYKKRFKLYIPDYFLCSTEFLIPTKVYFSVPRNKRIFVHADDMNQIIQKNKLILDPEKKTGVFLDQGIPFVNITHPLANKKPLPAGYLEEYYKNLEHTLHTLQEELGLDEVVIALHPDANIFREELSDKFKEFRTFMGVTKDLIRDSRVVFGHYSTAINFAIFYKKPVILLKDHFLMNSTPGRRENIQFFEKEFNLKSVEMDKEMIRENSYLKDIGIDEKRYQDYTRKYFKNNDIQENSYYYAIKHITKDLEKK